MSDWIKISAAVFLLNALFNTAYATTISINVIDPPGRGFNDLTPVSPVPGNDGTTLGEQRLNVFRAAADYWQERLDSEVEIVIQASFRPLDCNSQSVALGAAGPQGIVFNIPNAPRENTVYPVALGNSLAGVDQAPTEDDITAIFNSAVDEGCFAGGKWDYRLGVPTGTALQLYSTVVHEIAHGLGFLTFVNEITGRKLQLTQALEVDDIFMANLRSSTTGKDWPDMTDNERAASAISDELVWTGEQAAAEAQFLTSGLANNLPKLYAPNPVQFGSSVSHWDTSLLENELMEPFEANVKEDWLTIKAFFDMGWRGNPCNKTFCIVWTVCHQPAKTP